LREREGQSWRERRTALEGERQRVRKRRVGERTTESEKYKSWRVNEKE
jgi:hypothetical protein